VLLIGDRLPWPADWTAIFGRPGPLLVEVGFGSGDFLVELARRRPEANVLGLEIAQPSLRRAKRKIERAGLDNIRILYGDAHYVLWALCRPESLHGLVANFPDPWPKAGHHARRLIGSRFLQLAATRLAAGASLDAATDHPDYAAWIGERLAESPYFESRHDRPFLREDGAHIGSKYETRALAAGAACYYFQWRRNSRPAADSFPIPQELPLPHVVLSTPLTLAAISSRFEPQSRPGEKANVRLLALFVSPERDMLLVEAYINEEPVDQRPGLLIRQSAPGEVTVGLHDIGFPRPTAGVHLAIAHLAHWLLSLHPEAKILRHTLVNVPESVV
jgi:tRNA (guanine-N7-)-methyltransferase